MTRNRPESDYLDPDDIYDIQPGREPHRTVALVRIVSLSTGSLLPDRCPGCGADSDWRDEGWQPYEYSRGGIHSWLCRVCQGVKVRRFEKR